MGLGRAHELLLVLLPGTWHRTTPQHRGAPPLAYPGASPLPLSTPPLTSRSAQPPSPAAAASAARFSPPAALAPPCGLGLAQTVIRFRYRKTVRVRLSCCCSRSPLCTHTPLTLPLLYHNPISHALQACVQPSIMYGARPAMHLPEDPLPPSVHCLACSRSRRSASSAAVRCLCIALCCCRMAFPRAASRAREGVCSATRLRALHRALEQLIYLDPQVGVGRTVLRPAEWEKRASQGNFEIRRTVVPSGRYV